MTIRCLFSNVSGFVQNRDARTYGVEADLSVNVSDGLLLSGGVSVFDAKVKDVEARAQQHLVARAELTGTYERK